MILKISRAYNSSVSNNILRSRLIGFFSLTLTTAKPFALTFDVILILISVISTSYFNFNKDRIIKNYAEAFNNIYFKKTLNHFIDNLEPRFNKVSHNISAGETFDTILKKYNVNKDEIKTIKETLSKKVNLNKLNTTQKIRFILN